MDRLQLKPCGRGKGASPVTVSKLCFSLFSASLSLSLSLGRLGIRGFSTQSSSLKSSSSAWDKVFRYSEFAT